MRRLLLVLALFSLPALSFATISFNAENYKTATDSGYYLGVFGSQTVPQGKFNLGLSADWSQESVILLNAAGAKLQNIIGREITAQLYGTYGVLPWFDVGALVSGVPYMRFQPAGGVTTTTEMVMSDIQLNTRFRLLNNESFPIGLSVMPFITFPTGDSTHFTGDGYFTGGGMIVLDTKRINDRFSLSLNTGAEFRKTANISAATVVDNRLLYGVGANLAVHPIVDVILETRGFTRLSNLFDANQRPLEVEGGVRVYPSPHIAATIGGGAGLLEGMGNPTWRALASVSYVPEHKRFERKEKKKEVVVDTDGDGVPDSEDRCPTEAGPKANGGCPATPKVVISPEEYRILTRPIHFDFEKATLRPDALPILQTLADALKAKPTIKKLSIEGHCDYIGTDAFNNWLSLARAKSVQDYLVKQGVEPGRLSIIGYGKRRPVDPARNPKARAKNRRVEFVFKEVEGMTLPETIPASAQPTLPETNPESNPDLKH